MFATGIIIDLKNIKEENRKEFFILDKAVRSYSLGNNSDFNKLDIKGRYWTFTVNPSKDVLKLLYRHYKNYCKQEKISIIVYEYAIENDEINYKNMDHPEYDISAEFKINIHKIDIRENEIIDYGIDSYDFQKGILKEEDPFVVILIFNDYDRMDGIVKEFILNDYNKVKKESYDGKDTQES